MNCYKIGLAAVLFIIVMMSACNLNAQKKWNGRLASGVYYYSGNVNKFDFITDGNIAHTDSFFEYSTFMKVLYSEALSVRVNEEYQFGLKFDYRPFETFSPFLMFSYYKNRYKDIDLRLTGLIGLKYVFYKTETSNFSVSLACQYDAEQYASELDDQEKVRLSFRPKFKQKIGKTLYFENVEFVKFNMANSGDYIIESFTTISNKITDKISVGIVYNYEYVNEPTNPALKKADQVFTASLIFTL